MKKVIMLQPSLLHWYPANQKERKLKKQSQTVWQ